MGKQITSPSKKYPGFVVLPDYWDHGYLIAWNENISKSDAVIEGEDQTNIPLDKWLRYFQFRAQAIIPMVQEWHLTGLPEKPETLPATPISSARLIARWLESEIWAIINEDAEIGPFTDGASTPG